jgi:pimeloyl-ACP methyl ester carboxylesterase
MKKRKKKKIIIGIGIFILVNIVIFQTIPFLVINQMANRHVDFDKVWTAEEFGLEASHFFVKTNDGLNISAYEVAAENPKAVIVCIPGIHNPSATVFFGHARFFKAHGYATILFDMRAHGESEGSTICLGYREHRDVKAIVQYIKGQPCYENVPVVVFGLSMGAVTAINAAGEIPEIDGLISLSAYSSFQDIFYENMIRQAPKFLTVIEKPFVTVATSLKFATNTCRVNPKNEIRKLGNRPALLMHTKEDSEVPFSNFERILQHAPAHVETFVREGNMHLITGKFLEPEKDGEYAAAILQFLEKHFN